VTIKNWEVKATEPAIHFLPKIIEFLGYNPLPPAQTLGQRITRCRRTLGLSQRELAGRLGIDEGTLWHWEAAIVKKPWSSYTALFQEWLTRNEREVGIAEQRIEKKIPLAGAAGDAAGRS